MHTFVHADMCPLRLLDDYKNRFSCHARCFCQSFVLVLRMKYRVLCCRLMSSCRTDPIYLFQYNSHSASDKVLHVLPCLSCPYAVTAFNVINC